MVVVVCSLYSIFFEERKNSFHLSSLLHFPFTPTIPITFHTITIISLTHSHSSFFSLFFSLSPVSPSLSPHLSSPSLKSKPRGLRAGRTLKKHRQKNRWADKTYNKAHLLASHKAKPMGSASHAKGIVVERMGIEAKQPNSAIRK